MQSITGHYGRPGWPPCHPAAPALRSKSLPRCRHTSGSQRYLRDCFVQVASREAPPAVADHPGPDAAAAAADNAFASSQSSSSSSSSVSTSLPAAAAAAGGAGGCPFLSALPSPPPAQHKWWTRLQQLSDPPGWQAAALGPHKVVEAAAQLGLPGQILIGDADLAKAVMSGEGDITRQGNFLKGFARLIGPNSLLAVQEPKHKHLRALIMPAFEKPAIEQLVPRMERVLTKYLERWCEATAGGGTVKASDECKVMTFDFIINSVMGRDFSDEELAGLIQVYKVWSGGILAFPYINLPFTRFGRALAARQQLIDMVQVDIDRARAELAAGQAPAGILGSLVAAVDEEGNRLTDEQVQDNLLLLLLAGHDTSAVTVTNILAQLQLNPAALQRLREEQEAVMARHGSALSGAALRDMEYADAVIRETLRMLPVVPSLARQAARDFELGGYLVKEGQYVTSMLTHLALHDPRWSEEDAAHFRPERMLTPEGQKPGALLPFGHGPRFCAGYAVAMSEMKAFLALLARGYSFQADTNTQWVQSIGRVPANGLPMTVSRLSSSPQQ